MVGNYTTFHSFLKQDDNAPICVCVCVGGRGVEPKLPPWA